MGPAKIVRIVGVVLVLVAALIPGIPAMALGIAIAIVGLGVGYYVDKDNRGNLFLMVLVLTAGGASGARDVIPVIGMYLTAILSGLGTLLAAASVTVITMVVYERLTD